ncbi:MAG TPA: hypothetical protein VFD84_19915 [Candidatus Binatia bacterium]|jgi:FixJ family two-component response regulator|nr:hypothetical protein [Candidatus Binatia bacterium]
MTAAGRPRAALLLVLLSDDPGLAAAIGAELAPLGVPVGAFRRTASAAEARRLLAHEPGALFVLDDALPGLAGPMLLSTLVAQGVHPARVVYLANRHAVPLELAVRRHGVLYYTGKPPAAGVIAKLLGAALARARAPGRSGAALPPRPG